MMPTVRNHYYSFRMYEKIYEVLVLKFLEQSKLFVHFFMFIKLSLHKNVNLNKQKNIKLVL